LFYLLQKSCSLALDFICTANQHDSEGAHHSSSKPSKILVVDARLEKFLLSLCQAQAISNDNFGI
jgi:hypothetical protein